jgi:5-formyltetrahydrofolate cyclo-ligase
MLDKPTLRNELLKRLRLDPAERDRRSRIICERIQTSFEWRDARTVALFLSLPSEPALDGLLEAALSGDKQVVLPRIHDRKLAWIPVKNAGAWSRSPHFSQLEEPTGDGSLEPSQLDLVLVPGLGFGPAGQRLGRGGGYYDRALADLPEQTVRLGVCFRFQRIENIPELPHDERVHRVISD